MLFLLKYKAYAIAFLAGLLFLAGVFAWHKYECGKAYDEGVKDERAAVEKKTEQLRVTMQAKIDEAEAKSAEVITVVETKIKVVDREVIKYKFREAACPDVFSEFMRLRNEYIKAANSRSDHQPLWPESVPSNK